MSAYSVRMAALASEDGTRVLGEQEFPLETIAQWSLVQGKDGKGLPPIEQVSSIHVYDFDNTLFRSPLPNPRLWSRDSIIQLHSVDVFRNGGWWHDARILASTGEGADIEEKRAWEGWWNEHVVKLVRLSMQQRDALTVLLTGRSESGFSELIQRIVRSKGLEFDMICLKPQLGPEKESIESTMHFKTIFMKNLLSTYRNADEIRVYEDRIKHVVGFQKVLNEYAAEKAIEGRSVKVDVIQVAELTRYLDPAKEQAEIQKLIDDHNKIVQEEEGVYAKQFKLSKRVFFTGYLIDAEDQERVLQHFNLPKATPEVRVSNMCKGIVICPHEARSQRDFEAVERAGGIGAQVEFEACSFGSWQDRIFAAWVRAVDPSVKIICFSEEPMVVLAIRGEGRPQDARHIVHWEPLKENIRFKTTVGELSVLEIVDKRDWDQNSSSSGGYHRGHTRDGRFHKRGRYEKERGRGRGRGGYRGRGGGRGRDTIRDYDR